ncbi:MAG: hypothetical protein OXN17_00215 [Candidatus Poribacteria bacterium]|nr:hypothetical protein [Candidatus Poribacteria bacterium]MDE0503923.1 hypothetical protein [Candidatus Poribacteria bacterium]
MSIINERSIEQILATVFDVTLLTLLLTSLFLIGCSEGEEEIEMEVQYIDKGTCAVGLTLKPGESCGYSGNGEKIVFFVSQDGSACRKGRAGDVLEVGPLNIRTEEQTFCVNYDIESDDLFGTNFSASKNPDGSWTVNRDGSSTFVVEAGDDDTSLVLRFKHVIQFGDTLKAYDVQWRTKTPHGSWSSGCFDVIATGITGQTVTINGTISGLEPGTTYQVRYRDTNERFCSSFVPDDPDPWSPIGEGTTSGKAP